MKSLRISVSLVLAFLCLAACFGLCEVPDDVPLVVLDCDMGAWNDDAMALSLLLKAEEAGRLRILGITLEGGNNFIGADYENYGEIQTAALQNTKDFLACVDREDIPFYPGTDFPQGFDANHVADLASFYENLRFLQYNDGYGAVHFYQNLSEGTLVDQNDARDFLLSCAEQYPGRVTVFAIGPTMNLARAVEADAAFAPNIAAVYYMAGAFGEPCEAAYTDGEPVQAVGGANITPFAEYNACYDALSLQICLKAGFPVQYLFPGEINAPIDEAVIARLEAANMNRDRIVDAWLARYADAMPEYPYWDPVTVAAFLQPEFLCADERYVAVCTDRTDPHYAMTSSVFPDDYALLTEDEQAGYAKALIVTAFDAFWDCAIDLLCQ